ncbi:MAG: aminotransferase class V-fold PLP-dependent enzyme [Candidatus Marinimicrobia bacterium]|nr:aminotransferase class V-fold PLP-dependent enzyme [Candidatus Neomarinimicrobiota bacterium]
MGGERFLFHHLHYRPCLLCNPPLQTCRSESTDYSFTLHLLFLMLTPESRSADFPSLTDKFYFNTAAESIPPQSVFSAIEQYCRDKSLGMDGREPHFAELERCRESAAALLHRGPSEVSFCSCTSEAYNLLHSALQLSGTDEVVITDLDFPSGATPWICAGKNPTVRLWENSAGVLDLDDAVELSSYRNDKTFEGRAALVGGEAKAVYGATDLGTGGVPEEKHSPLSAIIQIINDRFGTDFTAEDKLLIEQVCGDMLQDEKLMEQARAGSKEKFNVVFEPKLVEAFVARHGRNEKIINEFMSNHDVRSLVVTTLLDEIYGRAIKGNNALAD